MRNLNLTIDGMSCGHCVSAVQKALGALPGVRIDRVTVGAATLSYDPGAVSQEQITQAVDRAGYTVAASYPGGAS